MATTSKPIVKSLPQFNPTYYLAWASDVRDAFEDRGWTSYLITPSSTPSTTAATDTDLETTTSALTPDAVTVNKARAFLKAAIPYEYKPGLETFTTAAEIWIALEQRYASTSREDELRLKSQLMDLRKSRSDTIDQHIQKYSSLLSSVLAQQQPERRFDIPEINSYFLRSLQNSNIPGEDWKGFITFLGKSWLTATKEQLYSDARTYYNTHIQPYLTEQTSEDSKVLAIRNMPQANRSGYRNFNKPTDNRNIRNNRGNINRNNGPRPRAASSSNNLWCDYHQRRTGHVTADCRARLLDPDYLRSQQQRSQQLPSDYEPPLVYTTTTPESRVNTIRAYKTVAPITKLWIYDTACTETMTSEAQYFFDYTEFTHPVPVSGIGKSTLFARGSGTIYLQSLPDLNNSSIHRFDDVWLVPGLDDSIISKHWTKQHGLKTSLDDQENIVLVSNDPKSSFKAITQSIGKITVFPHIQALVYQPKACTISTAPQRHSRIPVPVQHNRRQHQRPRFQSSHAQLMHERLGHTSANTLRILNIRYTPGNCPECILGKLARQPFREIDDTAPSRLYRVYCDLCGEIKPKSYGDGQYVLTLTDQLSRFSWIYILADKKSSTILAILKRWKAMAENQAGATLKFFRTDQGKEFTGMTTITAFFNEHGIIHETTTAYSSSSNGIAERLNRTLFDMVRPMMIRSQLPTPFWAEAIDTAVKIRNSLPTRSLNGRTPYELWFDCRRPSIQHFRQFGCIAYVHVPIVNIGRSNKVAPRSIRCCYLGVIGTKIYRLWDPTNKRIVTSRDVVFHENQFLDPSVFGNIEHSQHQFQTPFDTMTNAEPEPVNYVVPPHPPRLAYRPTPTTASTPATTSTPATRPRASQASQTASSIPFVPIPRPLIPRPSTYEFTDTESDHETPVTPAQSRPASPASEASSSEASSSHSQQIADEPRTSGRYRKPHHKVVDNLEQAQAQAQVRAKAKGKGKAQAKVTRSSPPQYIPSYAPPDEPSSIDEALRSPHAPQWLEAYSTEMDSLNANDTWTLVPRPLDRKVIGTRPVFRIKDAETSTPRFKARIVAQGYSQIPGLDYTDTFAPVVKATSLRVLLAIAFILHLLIYQFDFETAFLNPMIDHEVYVEQPPYFEVRNRQDWVYLLNKALYGLKQSPLLWSNDLKQALIDIGFEQSVADESIFIYDHNDMYIILAVYVDDILAFAASQHEIQFVFNALSSKFKLRNLGPVKKFLGLDIHRPTPTGPIYLSQSTYARKMLHKFNMANCNPVKSPCEPSVQLHKRESDEESADGELYRQMIGSLMFLAQYTRSDIAFEVSCLSQFNKDPSIHHLRAAKHLMRYIQGTKDFATVFNGDGDTHPIGYSDASYANNPDDRKSYSGYIFFLANAIISFQSQKQTVIALSTMESEYMALSDAAKEAIFLLKLLRSLKFKISRPIIINTDSQSALDHVKNNVKHSRTKHIDVRHHFIRDACSSKHVTLEHVPAASQIADVLTKPLGPTKHAEALKMLKFIAFTPAN
jgi:Reverse transcriptase (RNA-dependent DNA polymerase)/Integrase core domain/gag-polypeptide of LTR copia-type